MKLRCIMEIRLFPVITLILATQTTLTESVWSDWGSYGDCSRPCGGGLANKTRTCLGATHTCTGSDIRYRICNREPCRAEPHSLRETQCQSFNNVSLQDNYFHWIPVYKPEEPCVLYCETIETGFILKVQSIVANGTVCGKRDGGICIAGKCQRIGCNGVIGSHKKLDRCGVCGGDGSTCSQVQQDITQTLKDRNLYRWEVRWSPCSTSCGAGTQTSTVVCVDEKSNQVSEHCPPEQKPNPTVTRRCRKLKDCRFRWHTFKWSRCSRTCGTGTRFRKVVCIDHSQRKRRKRVPNNKCGSETPNIREECFHGDCPEWMTGPWSKCSVPCGYGNKTRKVVCKTSGIDCDTENQPAEEQECYSGKSCDDDTHKNVQQDDSSASQYDMFDDALLQSLLEQPAFRVSTWGPCSVTCGAGYRIRKVTCEKAGKAIPLSQCQGIEPHSKTECYGRRCPDPVISRSDNQYRWQHRDYGPCSSTCGGGRQITTMECVDTRYSKIVIDAWCFQLPKPHPLSTACNTQPCPPRCCPLLSHGLQSLPPSPKRAERKGRRRPFREAGSGHKQWNTVGEYGECRVPCGGGKQSRSLACVQKTVTGRITSVAFHRCPDLIPLSERSCNLQFCQAEWRTSDWGMCSVTCGTGQETRDIYCIKTVTNGVTVNVSVSECIGPRPSASRRCHLGECYKLPDLPKIKTSPGKYIQIKRMKRVNIIVGETAILLPNQSVKIKCPVKNFHRKLIFWTKDQRLIPLVGRVRVSSVGALRISRANPEVDKGTFTCTAGTLHATVNVTFQSKRAARQEASDILNTIFRENFNESFIDRPQADGILKKMNSKYFSDNSLETNHNYDYTAFTTTNWTKCSAKCGKGVQTRIVTCNHVTDRFIRLLPESACIKRGLVRPSAIQTCGQNMVCPSWIAGNWTMCSHRYCRRDGYATQKRLVSCSFPNGTRSKLELCDAQSRPKHKKLCKTRDCEVVWQTSGWSECEPKCGDVGEKLRTITCVWAASKRPAYDSCKKKPRPEVSKLCKPEPCNYAGTCKDRSRYCSLAGHLKMCRYHRFRQRCCHTCEAANL